MKGSSPQATLSIRVQPRASRNAIVGWAGDVLKVRLTAPPVEGEANEACLAILAKQRNFASTVIDLKQKSEPAVPTAPPQPTTESHPSGDATPAGH
jgi:uncharacterized protein (TIGR00251 family)